MLPSWFDYIKESCRVSKKKPTFVFVVGDSVDDTFDVISEYSSGYDVWVRHVSEKPELGQQRVWNQERYTYMAKIRNELLSMVRNIAPDYFLSLDSDILLHPQVLSNLLDTSLIADAVGGKCYMDITPRVTTSPSYGQLKNGQLYRPDHAGVVQADVLMAIKLMKPKAYKVDYRPDDFGEDLGWSKACGEAGLTLMWDGRICSKHVMQPEFLNQVDDRCGY